MCNGTRTPCFHFLCLSHVRAHAEAQAYTLALSRVAGPVRCDLPDHPHPSFSLSFCDSGCPSRPRPLPLCFFQFKHIENLNYAVALCRDTLRLNMPATGGVDLYEGNRTLVLGLVWQLMRMQVIEMLKDVGGGSNVTDADIVSWANAAVAASGRGSRLSSFRVRHFRACVVVVMVWWFCFPQLSTLSEVAPAGFLSFFLPFEGFFLPHTCAHCCCLAGRECGQRCLPAGPTDGCGAPGGEP